MSTVNGVTVIVMFTSLEIYYKQISNLFLGNNNVEAALNCFTS